jgi:hypothetical protein
VINAIQGEDFSPLWQQVLIEFNAGFTPHQFTSEDQILAAAAGPNPEITLVFTGEVYRCAVVEQKNLEQWALSQRQGASLPLRTKL